jgi:hypothetical protein
MNQQWLKRPLAKTIHLKLKKKKLVTEMHKNMKTSGSTSFMMNFGEERI